MDKNYFKENEEQDFKYIENLNKFLKLEKLGRAPEKHHYDASGFTTTGDYVAIEIKQRDAIYNDGKIVGKKFTDTTLVIDAHKLSSMLLDFIINKSIPLYVNFIDNGETAIVFNLSKLKNMPKNRRINTIVSRGYQEPETSYRYFLPISEGYIYRKIDGEWKRERSN